MSELRRYGRSAAAGFSAVEGIVALLVGLFVVHLGLSAIVRLRSVEAGIAKRMDAITAMRVARHVLRSELGRGVPGRDWMAAGDSISLRAFRGTGLVCPAGALTNEVTVSFSGVRRPDPSKDSVLLLGPAGTATPRALVAVGPAAISCGPLGPADLERWGLDAPAPAGTVVARVFERGSYHVALSALRYRRGSSGRQPLTPQVWDDDSRLLPLGDRLGLEVQHGSPEQGPDWEAFLAWTAAP
jgi:hypothetical protein